MLAARSQNDQTCRRALDMIQSLNILYRTYWINHKKDWIKFIQIYASMFVSDTYCTITTERNNNSVMWGYWVRVHGVCWSEEHGGEIHIFGGLWMSSCRTIFGVIGGRCGRGLCGLCSIGYRVGSCYNIETVDTIVLVYVYELLTQISESIIICML